MIDESIVVFPNNAIALIKPRLAAIDADWFVTTRPLRQTDPLQSAAVFAQDWSPSEDSYEMKGGFPSIHEPTLVTYRITVQGFIKDMDPERGLAIHTTQAKLIRTMIYRDDSLRVSLRSLSVLLGGSTERTQRFGIRSQRFVSNEIGGEWLYLSTLDFWLETETV